MLYPDGAKDIYGTVSDDPRYGIFWYYYLSQKVSPEGLVTAFWYEFDPGEYKVKVRLKHVVDADGKTNTLYYHSDSATDTLVTQIADPYGRSVYFDYDYFDRLLTNITDSASLVTTFIYDESGWITNMATPYGTTTFELVDVGYGTDGYDAWDRTARVTEANNGHQLYALIQNLSEIPDYGVEYYPPAQVPTNTPIGTLENTNLWSRNSYHWGALQYAALSTTDPLAMTTNDFLKARMRHWLGETAEHNDYKAMDTLSLERGHSPDGYADGQKTWFDYPNKGPLGAGDKGGHILPELVARVLPDGSTWYEWTRRNTWGHPTNVVETYTQPDGTIGLRTNQFVYAANGQDLVLHIGPQGEQVVSNYFGNAYHQVDASYDALNLETRYTYNANRQLTSLKTPAGLTTTNLYFASGDALNRLDKTIDLEINRTNAYTYSGDLVYSHTDERGLIVTNYWDNLSRLTSRKYPDGTTTSNIYTALDITATKDRLGFWSYTGYNGIRQKVAETNANGVITRYGLCDCGSVKSVTNAWNTPAQMVTSFDYDLQGNRLFTYHPDATTTNWFDSLRRVIATGDAWGYRWFGYNNQGLLTSITNAYGAEQITVFDIDDHPLYTTDANGVTLTNTYDDLGRLRTRTYPDTGVEHFGYSARGLIAYTNQLGYTNFYAYDEARRKICETNANWEVLRYTNNAAGDLLALVDGKNQVTKWNYDEYGRVTNKLDQTGTEILRYTYDADSRLASRWSAAKGTTYYTNDPVGNLTQINYPVSTDVTFNYDPLDRVTNRVDAAGTTVYTYAVGGQLHTEDGPWSNDTVTNTWNYRLRVGLDLQQPAGVWTNQFGYDAAKRLTNVTSQAGAFGYTFVGQASRLTQKLSLPNTSYITNSYDGNARLLSTTLKNSSHTTLNGHTYAYNAGHQRTQQVFNAGSTVNYTYDPIGQLKVADSATASEDRGYLYDAAWNLSKRTNNTTLNSFFVNVKNELTNSTPTGANQFDANGNLTQRKPGGPDRFYTYDDENRLTTVEREEVWRSEFTYDGLGRLRVRKEYDFSGGWNLTSETRYVYDGWRVIQERNGSDVPQVSYTRGTDLSGTLEGAGGIGGLLGRSHGYSAGNWSTHNFYHADGNGNVTYLVNSSQNKAAAYRYDPYGNTISSSGSLAAANTYRFSSKELHVNSGLYYYGFRFYDPNTQSWLNRDPIQEWGGVNLYAFGGNDAINFIDPFGQQFTPSGPIFSESPISGDANKCQTGTSTTGNAPVASPKPAAPLPVCSSAGAIQNITPTYSNGSCPCSGAEIKCFDYEKCELAPVAQGLNKPIKALVWVKYTKCSTCPEYACP